MANEMTVEEKIRESPWESGVELREDEFLCVHCGRVNPKTALYRLKCGKTPYLDDIALDLGRFSSVSYYEWTALL